jgi:hypothetical protein
MKNILPLLAISIVFMSFKRPNIDGAWTISKKENIVLYTRPAHFTTATSPDSSTIAAILDEQIECIKQINNKLGTKFNSKVTIFLYNLDEARDKIGTNSGGYSFPGERTIYYTFARTKNPLNGKNIYLGMHEMVHLVTTAEIGNAKTRFMGEGYAVAFTGNYSGYKDSIGEIYKKSIEMWMKEYITKGEILKPIELINDSKLPERVFYPQAGFFIDWLIDNYGIEKANKLYVLRKGRIKKDFEHITGEKFEDMEKRYVSYLQHYMDI